MAQWIRAFGITHGNQQLIHGKQMGVSANCGKSSDRHRCAMCRHTPARDKYNGLKNEKGKKRDGEMSC